MTNQGPREVHVILHPKEMFIGARYAGSEIEARKAASLQTAWRRGSIPIIVWRARPPGGRFSNLVFFCVLESDAGSRSTSNTGLRFRCGGVLARF